MNYTYYGNTCYSKPFNLTVVNSPPTFTYYLSNQNLELCTIGNYTLPASSDINMDTYTISIVGNLPTFANFTISTGVFQFAPVLNSDVGTQTITVELCDSLGMNETSTFKVRVQNSAPTFSTNLINQYV